MTGFKQAVQSLAQAIRSSSEDLDQREKIELAKELLRTQDPENHSQWNNLEINVSQKQADTLKSYLGELEDAYSQEIGREISQSIRNVEKVTDLRNRLQNEVDQALDETKELEKISQRLQDNGIGKIAGKEEEQVNELGRKLEKIDQEGQKIEKEKNNLEQAMRNHGIDQENLHRELGERATMVEKILEKANPGNEGSENSLKGPDPEGDPWIVSISDIHGFYTVALSCLKCLDDKGFKPVVNIGEDGSVEWAGNNYKLVFNGDVIDRGGKNEEAFQLVAKMVESGNASYNIGNHELAAMMPEVYRLGEGYYKELNKNMGKELLEEISNGYMKAATQGYDHVYVHAGQNRDFSAKDVNETLQEVAEELSEAWEASRSDYVSKQQEIGEKITASDSKRRDELDPELMEVFGWDLRNGHRGRGPLSGLAWMDWKHFNGKGPKQVVGHSKKDFPEEKYGSVNANTIRNNVKGIIEESGSKRTVKGKGNFKKRLGGESITVEQPDGTLFVLTRKKDGEVKLTPKNRL